MRQYFAPYTEWEDYKNGMYDLNLDNIEEKVDLAMTLLCDIREFYNTIQRVFIEWPIASRVNMTNKGCNRRAWLGQASCCIKYNVPEVLTRSAWKRITEEQKEVANKIADQCIREYETTLRTGKENVIIAEYQTKLLLD